MNYQKIYTTIIERGRNRILEGYTETHHIIPKCMGGTDSSDNLVKLTPEEHYICHLLLVKMYPKHIGLIRSAMFMTTNNNMSQQRNNKMYGWIKRKYSTYMRSENNPSKTKGPWNKGVTGYKNAVNFTDKSLKLFSDRMKANNPCAGIKPWHHPRATEYTKNVWKSADTIFEVWITNNKPSYCKLYRLLTGTMYDNKTISPYMNMVKYFRNGWIPNNDNDWKELKNE